MKKLLIFLLCVSLLFTFTGCKNENTDNSKLNIVTTVFPAFDFAREIAGDAAVVDMLLPLSSESHFYEPSLSDIAKIEQCDLFIYAGGDTDGWAEDVIESLGKELNVICMSSLVEPLHNGDEHGHSQGNGYDSHVWTSPKNAKLICQKITDFLCSFDALNNAYYTERFNKYSLKLDLLDNGFKEIAENKKRNVLVFADRFPFLYLAKDYGFNYLAAIDGCSSETEPTLADISNIIDTVKNENIPAVFYIEFSSQKTADSVCANSGAKKLLLHSCHNISKEDFDNGENYLSLMNKNIQNLKEALY